MLARLLVAAVAALIVTAAPAQLPAAAKPLTAEQLREDLRVMADTLRRKHPGVFHFTSRDAFERAVAQLHADLPRLSVAEAHVAMNRIASSVGDAHTFLEGPEGDPRLPINWERFGDEIRVIHAQPDYRDAVGTKVVAIGGKPVEEAFRRALELAAPNEHMALREWWATDFLARGVMLRGLKLAEPNGRVKCPDRHRHLFGRNGQCRPLPDPDQCNGGGDADRREAEQLF